MLYIKNILFAMGAILSLFFISDAMADHASPSFETGAAGAVMTTPGTTLSDGKLVLGMSVQQLEFDDISDEVLEEFGAADEHIHSVDDLFQYQVNIAFGMYEDFTIGAGIPIIERNNIRAAHHDMGMGEVELAGDSSGLGDMKLFGQYRFYHDLDQDMAIIGGVKTPTGSTDETELEGELFGTEHQPGSGSWDPFFGLAYNRSMGRTGLSANILYTYTTEGSQQAELGDSFNYNFALSTRFFSAEESAHHEHGHAHSHHGHDSHVLDYLDVVLELNGDVRGRDNVMGIEDGNTGGHVLYVSPGMRIGLFRNLSLYTSIGIPLVNDSNGTQSEPDYRIVGGISAGF